uniref:Putative secreted protein n=1 Tax=Anopheles darlingi TaxID=43151 RepID=A0A2M4DEP4_ANODA
MAVRMRSTFVVTLSTSVLPCTQVIATTCRLYCCSAFSNIRSAQASSVPASRSMTTLRGLILSRQCLATCCNLLHRYTLWFPPNRKRNCPLEFSESQGPSWNE